MASHNLPAPLEALTRRRTEASEAPTEAHLNTPGWAGSFPVRPHRQAGKKRALPHCQGHSDCDNWPVVRSTGFRRRCELRYTKQTSRAAEPRQAYQCLAQSGIHGTDVPLPRQNYV